MFVLVRVSTTLQVRVSAQVVRSDSGNIPALTPGRTIHAFGTVIHSRGEHNSGANCHNGHMRWISKLTEIGDDPDPRFTLANERTFLAWIRTSLALIATGVGIATFVPELRADWLRPLIACTFIVLGIVCSATAFNQWLTRETALRQRKSLPAPVLAPVLAYGAAIIAVLTLAIVLLQR